MFALVFMIELGALWKDATFCCPPSEQLVRDGYRVPKKILLVEPFLRGSAFDSGAYSREKRNASS